MNAFLNACGIGFEKLSPFEFLAVLLKYSLSAQWDSSSSIDTVLDLCYTGQTRWAGYFFAVLQSFWGVWYPASPSFRIICPKPEIFWFIWTEEALGYYIPVDSAYPGHKCTTRLWKRSVLIPVRHNKQCPGFPQLLVVVITVDQASALNITLPSSHSPAFGTLRLQLTLLHCQFKVPDSLEILCGTKFPCGLIHLVHLLVNASEWPDIDIEDSLIGFVGPAEVFYCQVTRPMSLCVPGIACWSLKISVHCILVFHPSLGLLDDHTVIAPFLGVDLSGKRSNYMVSPTPLPGLASREYHLHKSSCKYTSDTLDRI